MRRCVAMLIALCLCAGALVYAHAAITEQEEQLTVFPLTTTGDPSILEGRTATVDITCGDHLVWHTGYTFGENVTATDFEFIQDPPEEVDFFDQSREFTVGLAGGFGASTNHNFLVTAAPGYSEMINTVAAITPAGESKSMNLKLSDFVDYYSPDYTVIYEDEELYCWENFSLASSFMGEYYWDTPLWIYNRFMEHFKFPVGDDVVNITVTKDIDGGLCGIEYYPAKSPTLEMIGEPNHQGLWFVPIFRTEDQPLEAELPDGMGIYFVPWKETGSTYQYYRDGKTHTRTEVTPDAGNAVNIYPIPQDTLVVNMILHEDAAWLLTLEHGAYMFRVIGLEDGTVRQELELLPYHSTSSPDNVGMEYTDRYLLVTTATDLALVDLADFTPVLTAPLGSAATKAHYYWEAAYGTLEFDGENLILMNTTWQYDGLYWVAAYDRSGLLFYGEYDCGILRGNDELYYNYVTAYQEPITLN